MVRERLFWWTGHPSSSHVDYSVHHEMQWILDKLLSMWQSWWNRFKVGWNASVPQCIDSEAPTFHNCPTNPVYVLTDENGQLMPAAFDVPRAADNSGSIAWVRVTPEDFEPPQLISRDMDVVYTAFDDAGNTAECVVQLRIPGTH